MKILIRNGNVLRLINNKITIEKVDIAIQNNIISKIGTFHEGAFDKVIDATDQVVMPGMINMHTHIPMKVLQGMGEGVRLESWLQDIIWPIERQMTADDVYVASKMAIVELLYGGVTCFNDMYFFAESMAKAVNELGIRGILSNAFFNFDITEEKIHNTKKLIEKYRDSELVDISLGIHQLCDMKRENMQYLLEEFHGLVDCVHIHVAETAHSSELIFKNTGETACEHLLSLDMKDYNVLAAHCVHFNSNDTSLLKEKNIYPINNPVSNAKLASGISPVQEFLNEGVKVCIGTDGSASNNNLNFLEELKVGALVQKLKYNDPTAGQVEDFFKMSTINGAIALKKEDSIGSIDIGKKADIVTFPLDYTMLPTHNILSNLIYSGSSLKAKNVIIDGKVIIDNGVLVSDDMKKIVTEFEEMTLNLIKRANQNKGENNG